jgi:hypothetical protein
MSKLRISSDLQAWIEARKRYRLSHAVVQMARELGMNPRKLDGHANTRQEPWKLPFQEYISELYSRRFGKDIPDPVVTIEEIARRRKQSKELKRARKAARSAGEPETGGQ